MRAPFLQIPILLLLGSMAFVPVDVALGQEWGSSVFDLAPGQPLPIAAYPFAVSGPDVRSPSPASYPSGPRYDFAMASHTGTSVSAISYEEDPVASTGSPGPSGLTFGYDRGFLIASLQRPEAGDGRFGPLQKRCGSAVGAGCGTRPLVFHGPNPDRNQFEFERLRLAFKGRAAGLWSVFL